MRFIFIIGLSWLCTLHAALAQSPQKFSFQGVARDQTGKVLTGGSSVEGVSFMIRKGAIDGPVEYKEIHSNVLIMDGGIFNLQIGAGNQVLTGDMKIIDWGSDKYYLQIQFTLGDGQTHDLGAVQLLSVPYAMHSTVAESWRQNAPIVQHGTYGSGPSLGGIGDGPRLVWYPKKAALLAGRSLESLWSDNNIGNGSIALGSYTLALGEASAAIGNGTVAKASGALSVGAFNDNTDNPVPDASGIAPTDRIFQVGNGAGPQNPSNALTVLRNGNVGIGNGVLAPSLPLEVSGRIKIQHSGTSTAGIHLNNSSNNAGGFMGMITDEKVGFYIGNKWRFQVTGTGFVGIGANVVNPT
ncbi:hypothetical protein [Dyadobacter fermentans]|uniref:Uncharacterized protein n=1 Tax=Dyadobacter fermentans (strain ATCC 700827 / DSM 18053 / CIP 107007 / KCTC 52180 / NS114) TaxID=471854 RepID=C6VS35_DYAFD|nr:hypothetical protein [Dyadobacter fermentans]ACT94556.1 hypothetical protein Dfer_3345 [Dyadobacter fermentans DSM 18053]